MTASSYQAERLQEVIAATSIQSPTRFTYDGEDYDAGPHAVSGQFGGAANPVPILGVLANYLYANAYCTRPGAESWSAQVTEQEEGEALVKELGQANTGKDRRSSGWLVAYTDPNGSYVAVTRRGIHRYVPMAEVERPAGASAPATGDLVRIRTPRESVDEGFYMANGDEVESSMQLKSPLRFYWNTPLDAAPTVMRVLTATLNGNGIPFSMKMPRYPSAFARFDSCTMYLFRPWLGAAVPHLASAYQALAGRLSPDVPLFTKRVAPGLGFAEDPGGGESFGTHRTRLLAEALWAAYAAGATEPADRLAAVRHHFRRSGLQLERAHVNPWAVDRYDDLRVA